MVVGIVFVAGVVILVLTLVITWGLKLAANNYVVVILVIAVALIVPQIAKWRPITLHCREDEDE